MCAAEQDATLLDDNQNNEYLRFGRENNGYIRFGRNDPFLRFGKKNDPFLRFGKQDPFLRIGRQDPFLRFGRQDPFLRIGRQDPFLRIGRQDPFLRFGRNDPYLRFGRNDPYLRFGKNDPFLRFGKSLDSQIESGVDAVTLSREHDFAQQNGVSDRRKRSLYNEATDKENSQTSLVREAREATASNSLINEPAVRDIRNGHYMRFGKKSEVDVSDGSSYDRDFTDNELSNLLRNYDTGVSLPVYGKRGDHATERKQEYMRFGREAPGN